MWEPLVAFHICIASSGGEYTASVADLPGANASGSNIQTAEDNLGSIT
jgi:hypothetical protein